MTLTTSLDKGYRSTYSLESSVEGCSSVTVSLESARPGDLMLYRFTTRVGRIKPDKIDEFEPNEISALELIAGCEFYKPISGFLLREKSTKLEVFYARSHDCTDARLNNEERDELNDARTRLEKRLNERISLRDAKYRRDPESHLVTPR